MKKLKLLLSVLALAAILTAASLFHTFPGESYCAPPNPGPLDELAISQEDKRGYPFPYLVHTDSDSYCELTGGVHIFSVPLGLDLLIWSVPSAVLVTFVVFKRKYR